MTLPQAIRAGFRNYGRFGGRATRSAFWWWALFTTVTGWVLSAIPAWTITHPDGAATVALSLSGLWGLAVLLPSLAVQVRRLRDAGFGWGHVFWIFLPVAGLIIIAAICAQPSQRVAAAEPVVG